ncbi:hypothetical protein CT856_06045 [Salmonella enterica]|nr:hypothetical protein [Salmonella enterica]
MRVVVCQGQFGVFKEEGLDLSMPAIQTCIGVFGHNIDKSYIVCAHFDTDLMLEENLDKFERSMMKNGFTMRELSAVIFGGDGEMSRLRCSKPSVGIGYKIINYIRKKGGKAGYSDKNYSGLVPQTFNLHYRNRFFIRTGEHSEDLKGGKLAALEKCRERIALRPDQYRPKDAIMTDYNEL